MRKLSARQALFVQEYLIDLNAKDAVIRAGFVKNGAKQAGYALLQKPHVQAAITAAMAGRVKRMEIDQDEVLREIYRLGFSNIADYIEWGPNGVALKPSADMSEEALRCILEVSENKTEKGSTLKFKLHDKKGSLELLGRHLGIFTDINVRVGFRWEDALKDLE